MASKRKADDFIYTLSDNEELPIEEEVIPEPNPPKKKAKKSKKGQKSAPLDDEEIGIWGKKEEDDGAMDSDFEFAEHVTTDFRTEDFEGWGFDGAKKGMNGISQKRMVDVDEIVRRRRGDKGEDAQANGKKEDLVNGASDDKDEDEDEDIELDDEDDEVLAEDGFGMGAASDEESGEDAAEDESDQNEDGEGDASDNDSVATPVDHPDDAAESDATDEEEDPEEAAKREAFFAPEEKKSAGKQKGKSSFQNMSLSRPILRGLNSVGFNEPTPIQAKTIPLALEGKDLVGGAITGSGKTGAFVVPILERLLYRPNKIPTSRVVILTPTRELAIQCHSVATKLASHTDIKFCLAVGGLSLKVQEAELRLRPDVVIATPGRFIDHMRNSASFSTDTVEILVLDEADRMLEDGFADELNEILTTLPKSRQTMLFSATMTSSVDRLIRAGLNKPVRVMVDSQRKTNDKLEQKFVRLRPGREEKRMGYLIHICKTMHTERVIIFFRQKKEAHRARIIFALFNLTCAELHGSMNQAQRISSVEDFRDGKVSFLLATDLASRGLDIKGVDTVINYEGPQTVEIYVHRVGRTARAGRSGVAITLAAEPDRKVVKAAVRAGKAQGAKISSLIIDPSDSDKWQDKIDEMKDEIEDIAREEKEEKQLAQVEMQIKKGENMVVHEDEIKSRPKRTWFETQHDKKKAQDAGRTELNGLKESLKKKGNGRLSNKDKKKLDAKSVRTEGMWKKGTAERAGKGAVLNFKNDKKNLRERYRERILSFHLNTFPYYKHHIQSRIYRFILDRQRRRREQSRLVDHARRLLIGRPALGNKRLKDVSRATTVKMSYMPENGVGSGNYGADGGRERGTRRKKFAAMAGSMYRATTTAVNEIRESYNQTRSREFDTSNTTIPGSFPDVAIVTKGNEQMVLFPTYAKRHVKIQPRQFENPGGPPPTSTVGMNEQEYWRNEWSRHEDEKAIVDVDVRGWIYNPHRGPMTRTNRLWIGLARQLSGIPTPRAQQPDSSPSPEPSLGRIHQRHEEEREQESIAREAREIERRGKAEEEAAERGKYSERPRDDNSDIDGHRRRLPPTSPVLRGRTNTVGGTELTEAELAVANANLMARIAPFLTTPIIQLPITLFFYNESQVQSRTVTTNDAGHFSTRVPLDFDISCEEPVQIIEPKGRSNIAMGTKEVFRNTFARELRDLTVDGVRDWYGALHDLGVRVHYCSNSPWQLYPVLATFFKLAGLPPGSLHLKQYTGVLQGIFEPVAERKKGTLERIMRDFPERKFLLVGDSGEADLEVYTELAIANPGRIAAIFIRDVTTPEQTGYFDSGINQKLSEISAGKTDASFGRPPLPPRSTVGDLIDLSEDPPLEPLRKVKSDSKVATKPVKPTHLLARKPPPPKPTKPNALQGTPAAPVLTNGTPRKTSQPTISKSLTPSPLAQMIRSVDQTDANEQTALENTRSNGQTTNSSTSANSSKSTLLPPPPPPPPRRRATPSSSTTTTARSSPSPRLAAANNASLGFGGVEFEALPLAASGTFSSGGSTGSLTPPAANKKLDLWRRRLQRAQETLERHGVKLYTWRRGDEVVDEAVGIVRECLREMGVK
ncbi:hypothetical protein F4781DRAFT_423643 [Annulohypoxylon bovei var. microspora]|nr:hypothetical protein F4781DRAFT_423643 [Annulohypoxylon bovei var. microspora]